MPSRRRVMFVSSNGTGLGHLTRSMAIARRLDRDTESLFVTLSRAAPVVREMGFPVEYMASHGSPAAGSDLRWSRRMTARLRAAISEAAPDLLVFDGDPALRPAAGRDEAGAGHRLVPSRPVAGGGEHGSAHPQPASSTRSSSPGDFAASADAGPTSSRRDEVARGPADRVL